MQINQKSLSKAITYTACLFTGVHFGNMLASIPLGAWLMYVLIAVMTLILIYAAVDHFSSE